MIDGLMLEITWNVMQQYLTSIPIAVFCRVGIPLGFVFGLGETVKPFQQCCSAYESAHRRPDSGSTVSSLSATLIQKPFHGASTSKLSSQFSLFLFQFFPSLAGDSSNSHGQPSKSSPGRNRSNRIFTAPAFSLSLFC
jgi:hypothetical protein